ncbi:hypothetical protein Airi01_074450 [Actinoallomurus iriomotensis]|uniref:Uncharacterized protein n=1 Tax=Actinoallomurus iriomotensis TaxID=478107 RepID=A0A9W6VNU3_9ACTN|nr:hypothetical protein Airi01_074450 [Actinoallomurus iriomotensis]
MPELAALGVEHKVVGGQVDRAGPPLDFDHAAQRGEVLVGQVAEFGAMGSQLDVGAVFGDGLPGVTASML